MTALLFLIALAAALLVGCGSDGGSPPATVEDVEDCFNPLDGNLDALEDLVRPLLISPSSMRTHRTGWVTGADGDGYHRVRMEYSAENVFGARLHATALGKVHGRTCRAVLIDSGLR